MKKFQLDNIIKEEMQSQKIKKLGLKPAPRKKDYPIMYRELHYSIALTKYISYLLDYIKTIS